MNTPPSRESPASVGLGKAEIFKEIEMVYVCSKMVSGFEVVLNVGFFRVGKGAAGKGSKRFEAASSPSPRGQGTWESSCPATLSIWQK